MREKYVRQVRSIEEEVFGLPCAAENHHPLSIKVSELCDGHVSFYGHVRTTSWELDGCGGRTDVHDLFAAFWAAVLRANGAASAQLIDIAGWCGFPELESRVLVFERTSRAVVAPISSSSAAQRIKAHTAWAWHALEDVFRWREALSGQGEWFDEDPPFLPALSQLVSFSPSDTLMGRRRSPDWCYFTAYKPGITIAVLPPRRLLAFRRALTAYAPRCSVGRDRVTIVANGLHNAVPNRTIRSGVRIISRIESASGTVPWNGADAGPLDKAIILIPLDSHCMLLGLQTAVVLRAECGLRAYEAERTKFLQRRGAESTVFYADAVFTWAEDISDSRFEELAHALLEREPGVQWIRQSGPTRERDAGRDFIARWTLPPASGAPGVAPEMEPPVRPRHILVQVKAHRPSVGKAKVRDIRDTLERHAAEGYFLVAFPQPASSLVEHLGILARNGLWTDWWDRAQLEARLRAYPDIVARFADVVTMARSER